MISGAWIGILSQIKFAKYLNHDISNTHSINTKFEGEFQVHKGT